jgi:hypothetical protein
MEICSADPGIHITRSFYRHLAKRPLLVDLECQEELPARNGEGSAKIPNIRRKLQIPLWLAAHITWRLPWEVRRNKKDCVLTIQWHFEHESMKQNTGHCVNN